jgi:hypothetical protein
MNRRGRRCGDRQSQRKGSGGLCLPDLDQHVDEPRDDLVLPIPIGNANAAPDWGTEPATCVRSSAHQAFRIGVRAWSAAERQQIVGVNGHTPTVVSLAECNSLGCVRVVWRARVTPIKSLLYASLSGPREGEKQCSRPSPGSAFAPPFAYRQSWPFCADGLRRQTRRSVHVELRPVVEPSQREQGSRKGRRGVSPPTACESALP